MGYSNHNFVNALHELIGYVKENAEVQLGPGFTPGGSPTIQASGGGITSEWDLGGISRGDDFYLRSDREQSLMKWESNLNALKDFLEHVRENLDDRSYDDEQSRLAKAPAADPIEPLGP